MKKIIFSLLFLFIYSCATNKDNLKFVYIPSGIPTDIEYEPCFCKISIWDEYNGMHLDTIKIYNKKEIDVFLAAFDTSKIEYINCFADFPNAFIYKRGKEIDTIYSNNDFSIFAKEKKILDDNVFLTLEGIKTNVNLNDFIPKKIIKQKANPAQRNIQ